jgi:hypothetical protein
MYLSFLVQGALVAAIAVVLPVSEPATQAGAPREPNGAPAANSSRPDLSWSVRSRLRKCTRRPAGLRCVGIDAQAKRDGETDSRRGSQSSVPTAVEQQRRS